MYLTQRLMPTMILKMQMLVCYTDDVEDDGQHGHDVLGPAAKTSLHSQHLCPG